MDDHKKKYTSSKDHTEVIAWYLKWEKQEKHIEVFPFHQQVTEKSVILIRFWILHSNYCLHRKVIGCCHN